MRVKPYSAVEWCGIVLGGILFLGGLAETIWPRSGLVPHLSGDETGTRAWTDLEIMTPTKARFCGASAMVVGATIIGLAAYREKK